jgi:hypothetical protein
MVTDERVTRRRYERRESREQFERRHHPILCPADTERLDPIGDAASGKHPESLEREGRTRPISA